MTFKNGVQWYEMAPQITAIVPTIDACYQHYNAPAVCTSARDGKHMTGSLHYQGRAIDLHISNVPYAQQPHLLAALRDKLGPDFDVVLERDHIHLEYDPRGEK